MRYLNYIYNAPDDGHYELTLDHPNDLVSLSAYHVKISNINKCVNLKNLYSEENTYQRKDIVPLKNLRNIYSGGDKYEQNGNCFL